MKKADRFSEDNTNTIMADQNTGYDKITLSRSTKNAAPEKNMKNSMRNPFSLGAKDVKL